MSLVESAGKRPHLILVIHCLLLQGRLTMSNSLLCPINHPFKVQLGHSQNNFLMQYCFRQVEVMILSFVPDPTSSLWGVLQSLLGLPWWLRGKESTCNVGHSSSIPGLGRSPGRGHGNSLQYSCLENPQGQRSLAVYSPWHHKESDTTKRVSTRSVPLPTLSSSHSPNIWVDQIS